MTNTNSNLTHAHRGYIYQDLVTSYFFAISLVERYTEITVDKKIASDDRFDDLEILNNNGLVRRQFKSSEDSTLTFQVEDLRSDKRQLKIDHLVRTYKNSGNAPADEYRICTTWLTPSDPDFLRLLEPVSTESSFPGYSTRMFRLRADLIWPPGGTAIWKPLKDATDFTYQDFIEFVARFIIELELPQASTDLLNPGPLEVLLLRTLSESVGIGRYPNHTRTTVDVASRLLQLAARARASSQTLTPDDVEREIQLQKDLGRIDQQFYLDKTAFVNRKAIHEKIIARIDNHRVIVVGSPGSGKSWLLTGLVNDLQSKGYLVARHYCYLEPGDPQVQRRITTNTMFANLIYDLIKNNPALKSIHRPAYSAGPRELEQLLKSGIEKKLIGKVVLIVDGVDHVSRVFAEVKDLSVRDVDIVEELAAIDFPEEVCLIIGSQPGSHLNSLNKNAIHIAMPSWSFNEIASLARKLGTLVDLRNGGFSHKNLIKDFLKNLHNRSEGNPLYATFLCRQITSYILQGKAFDPIKELINAPLTEGQISVYYDFLLKQTNGSFSSFIAETLGLVDFGLTKEELCEMYPSLAHHIDSALLHLSPVLGQSPNQNGFRIYHESFRRFIVERLRTTGGSIAAALNPIITLLKQRDFYKDSRSFRFLPVTLRRAGYNKEVLELIGSDFVSQSIEAGQPREAIEQNLHITTQIAATEIDWAVLVRCNELHRACYTCFEEKLLDYDLYGRAFVSVYGASYLVDRMLLDGKPTFSAFQGLLFCSLCDDAGVIPPWQQYLSLTKNINYEDDYDEGYEQKSKKDDYDDATFHGIIRLYGLEVAYNCVVNWLNKVKTPAIKYFRNILKRLVQFSNSNIIIDLLDKVELPEAFVNIAKLELTRALGEKGELVEATKFASEVLENTDSIDLMAESVILTTTRSQLFNRCPNLEGINVGCGEEDYYPKTEPVRLWVNGVRVIAAYNISKLNEMMSQIKGISWYKNWLRFVIDLVRAEEKFPTNPTIAENTIISSLQNLASDVMPFKGKPRACDLYYIEGIIHETLSRALNLIKLQANWSVALKCLNIICQGTTTYLQNSPTGPLTPLKFIEILSPFAKIENIQEEIVQTAIQQFDRVRSRGELYDTIADMALTLAKVIGTTGNIELAKQFWQQAAVHLCAYGFRKDLTLLELIESTPSLAKINKQKAINLLLLTQFLVNGVIAHTDGKETQYMPIYWIKALSKVNEIAAITLLSNSLNQHGGLIDWRYEDSLGSILSVIQNLGDPLIVAFIKATLPFAGNLNDAEERLSVICRLFDQNESKGKSLIKIVAAQIHGDCQQFDLKAYSKVEQVSSKFGITIPQASRSIETERKQQSPYKEPLDPFIEFRQQPIVFSIASSLDIMNVIRSRRRAFWNNNKLTHYSFLNNFGYRLVELIDTGNEDEAKYLIRIFARETYFETDATPLADLGEGFERLDHKHFAAFAFSLAYAYSRDPWGRGSLGEEKHLPWLMHATYLSKDITHETLAEEVAYIINQKSFYGGISKHLIKFIPKIEEREEIAFDIWQASYEVIQHRLPNNKTDRSVFKILEPIETAEFTTDESAIFLLLSRISHPELNRKTTALVGFASLVETSANLTVKPLKHFLNLNTPISSALLVLKVILEMEPKPYWITTAIKDELKRLLGSQMFGLRVLAQMLLNRVDKEYVTYKSNCFGLVINLSKRKKEAIFSLDWGQRVNNISNFWPRFPDLISSRFHTVWESSKIHKDIAKSRHEDSSSLAYKQLTTNLLFWENEVFETVFHEVLDGIEAHLSSTGRWHSEFAPCLLEKVTPNISLHITRWYSRVPRPKLPYPSNQKSQLNETVPICENGEYDGWYRCGYFEQELLIDLSYGLSGKINVESSVVMSPKKLNDIDLSDFSLTQGEAKYWLQNLDARDNINLSPFVGVLTGLDLVTDWLGSFFILALHPSIIARTGLYPLTKWDYGFKLFDNHGSVAVVFRWWSEIPIGESISEETPKLQGCDLLVRSDIFSQILLPSKETPVTVTSCSKIKT